MTLRFRTGVNAGSVLSGEGENVAIGDVNVAARLGQAAARGCVWRCQLTLLTHLGGAGSRYAAQSAASLRRMRPRQRSASKTTGLVAARKSSSVVTNRCGASTCGK